MLEHKLHAFHPSCGLKNPSIAPTLLFRCSPKAKAWTCRQLSPDQLTNPITHWLVSCTRLFAESLLYGIATHLPTTWFQGHSSIRPELRFSDLPLTIFETNAWRDVSIIDCILESWLVHLCTSSELHPRLQDSFLAGNGKLLPTSKVGMWEAILQFSLELLVWIPSEVDSPVVKLCSTRISKETTSPYTLCGWQSHRWNAGWHVAMFSTLIVTLVEALKTFILGLKGRTVEAFYKQILQFLPASSVFLSAHCALPQHAQHNFLNSEPSGVALWRSLMLFAKGFCFSTFWVHKIVLLGPLVVGWGCVTSSGQ